MMFETDSVCWNIKQNQLILIFLLRRWKDQSLYSWLIWTIDRFLQWAHRTSHTVTTLRRKAERPYLTSPGYQPITCFHWSKSGVTWPTQTGFRFCSESRQRAAAWMWMVVYSTRRLIGHLLWRQVFRVFRPRCRLSGRLLPTLREDQLILCGCDSTAGTDTTIGQQVSP